MKEDNAACTGPDFAAERLMDGPGWTGGLDPVAALSLLAASFAGSFMTVAMGIGGGAFLLAMMASLVPPAALIPVHGVIQLGSNSVRAALFLRQAHWPVVGSFTIGALAGVMAGGALVVDLRPALVQIGVGLFILWSLLRAPPARLIGAAWLNGAISSFLTMFFGATGPFVINFIRTLGLPRTGLVATHAVLMTLQHGLKVAAFAALGFAFGPWLGFLALMIGAGALGTLAGRQVLLRIDEATFRRALAIVLTGLALRLIYLGLRDLSGTG